jgi:hypothetical protein
MSNMMAFFLNSNILNKELRKTALNCWKKVDVSLKSEKKVFPIGEK